MGRYTRKGRSKIAFVPTISSLAAPTIAEITAGTVLDTRMAEMSGFQFKNSVIKTPDLSTTFVSQIPGEDEADDSSITFYDDDGASDAVRTALVKGAAGFIVLMPQGKVATKRCEVWPATSTGFNDEWTVANEAAKAMAQFSITAPPNQSAVVTA
jgi:hypothetical protein